VGPSLCITDQVSQEENLLGGTSPFTGQSLHPSPVQSARSIQRTKTVQAPIQVLIFHLFLMGPSLGLTDHEAQEENLLGGTNPFTGQFFYPRYLLYKAQHMQHMQTVQVPKKVLIFHLFCGTRSLRHRSRKWGPRDLPGGTNPFPSRFLHPSLAQSSRSIQPMKTVQVPKQALSFHLFGGTKSLPHRSKNSGRELEKKRSLGLTDHEAQEENLLGGTNPFTGQFFYPRYFLYKAQHIQHMQTVQVLKQVLIFHLFCGTRSLRHRLRKWSPREFARWNKPFYKSFLTPISCSKLKIHSAYEDSAGSKTSPKFSPFSVSASQIKKLRKRICWVEPPFYRSVLTPISCTKLKIHSAHANSPGSKIGVFSCNLFFFVCVYVCVCGTNSLLHQSKNTEREFAG